MFNRTLTHRTRTRWFIDIATITVEHIASRAEAMAAEHEAIRTEKPKYNVRRDANSYPVHLFEMNADWIEAQPPTKARADSF